MQETLDLIVETLQQNGGSMRWEDLMEVIPYDQRARVPDALKIGKSTGLTQRAVSVENGEVNHTVSLVSQ